MRVHYTDTNGVMYGCYQMITDSKIACIISNIIEGEVD